MLTETLHAASRNVTALGLDLVSAPQSLGVVSVSIQSGLCLGLVSVWVVLTATLLLRLGTRRTRFQSDILRGVFKGPL